MTKPYPIYLDRAEFQADFKNADFTARNYRDVEGSSVLSERILLTEHEISAMVGTVFHADTKATKFAAETGVPANPCLTSALLKLENLETWGDNRNGRDRLAQGDDFVAAVVPVDELALLMSQADQFDRLWKAMDKLGLSPQRLLETGKADTEHAKVTSFIEDEDDSEAFEVALRTEPKDESQAPIRKVKGFPPKGKEAKKARKAMPRAMCKSECTCDCDECGWGDCCESKEKAALPSMPERFGKSEIYHVILGRGRHESKLRGPTYDTDVVFDIELSRDEAIGSTVKNQRVHPKFAQVGLAGSNARGRDALALQEAARAWRVANNFDNEFADGPNMKIGDSED
jgi:hypothetical protein